MNLSKASYIFRRIVFVFVGLISIYVAAKLLTPTIKQLVYRINPPKDLPTVLFGKLDAPEFLEKKNLVNSTPQFILNTKNGRLPTDLPKQLPVFRYKQPSFSFELGKEAQRTAAYLGYTDEYFQSQTSDDVFIWSDLTFNSVLRINKKTKELINNTPMSGKVVYYNPGSITRSNAESAAKTMLLSTGRLNDGMYGSGETKVYLGRYLGNEIRPVNKDSEAQIARVDFFREFASFKIVGPDYFKGVMQVWVGIPNDKALKTLQFPKVEAYYWPLLDKEADQKATYPLIPVNLAWEEVQKGNGVISGIWPKDGNPFEGYQPIRIDKILINNIFMAYYDSYKLQNYMQPIFVFEGIYNTTGGGAGEIAIYYPAVSGDYVLPIETEVTPNE